MAESRKPRSRSPIVVALGLVLLAVPGFALGLLFGVAWEEPSLLASHLLGRTEEVTWSQEGSEEQPEALPDVAAGAPDVTRMRPEVLSPEGAELPEGGAAEAPAPAVAASSPPAPPPVAAAPRGHFAVQVGAFGESRTAEDLARKLRSKGYDVYVSPGAKAGEARWRVRVGPQPTREKAESVATRLKTQEKLPTWVLDENGPV